MRLISLITHNGIIIIAYIQTRRLFRDSSESVLQVTIKHANNIKRGSGEEVALHFVDISFWTKMEIGIVPSSHYQCLTCPQVIIPTQYFDIWTALRVHRSLFEMSQICSQLPIWRGMRCIRLTVKHLLLLLAPTAFPNPAIIIEDLTPLTFESQVAHPLHDDPQKGGATAFIYQYRVASSRYHRYLYLETSKLKKIGKYSAQWQASSSAVPCAP